MNIAPATLPCCNRRGKLNPKTVLAGRVFKGILPGHLKIAVLVRMLFLLLLVSSSCKPVQPQWEPGGKLPEGVLDREAMIDLLVEIHLVEGDLLERNLPAEEQEPLLKAHYGPVLYRHNITAKQLSDSYAYYVERPLTLNAMYVQVIEKLNLIQAQVQADIQSKSESTLLPEQSDQAQPAGRPGTVQEGANR